MKRRLLTIATLYILNIFIFAIIYFANWYKNSSHFILNPDFNETTIEPTWIFSELPSEFEYIPAPRDIKQTNRRLSIFYDKIHANQQSILLNKSQIELLDTINDKLYLKLGISSDRNLLEQIKINSEDVTFRIDSITELYSLSYDSLKTVYDVIRKSKIKIRLAHYNAELAQLAYEKSIISLNVHEDRNRDFIKYYDLNMYSKYTQNQDSISILESKNVQLYDSIFEYQKGITNTLSDYHQPRYSKLGFVDFLYFSATTATSGGYGDFVPNDRIIRLCVTIQILISMILFALFFYFLGIKTTDANPKN